MTEHLNVIFVFVEISDCYKGVNSTVQFHNLVFVNTGNTI